MSVAVTFDKENQYRTWFEENINELIEFLLSFENIVGFAIKNFDNAILNQYQNGCKVSLDNKSTDILEIIEKQEVNPQSGELYITDSISTLAENKRVVVHKPDGEYLDGGYPLGWLLTNLTVAKSDPEIWPEIKKFIQKN